MEAETAEYLKKQAAKCRTLAATTLDKRVAGTLIGMAEEYEQKARSLEQGTTST